MSGCKDNKRLYSKKTIVEHKKESREEEVKGERKRTEDKSGEHRERTIRGPFKKTDSRRRIWNFGLPSSRDGPPHKAAD